MTRPAHPPLATALVANIGGARRLPAFREHIRHYRPDFIVLSEMPRWRRWWKRIPGYRIAAVAPLVKGDRRSVAVMIAEHVDVEHGWDVRIRRPWQGPEGRTHHGRAWTPLRLRIRGERIRVCGAHFPWGYERGRNLAAWNEALDCAEEFLDRPGHSPLVLLGDLNAGADKIGKWADEHGWDFASFGAVSSVVGSGCTVAAKRLDPKAGHGWGAVFIRA